MTVPYTNFNTKLVNGQSLVHLINVLLGEDIVGVELGTGNAQTLCTFIQQCPNIKSMYGIDNYQVIRPDGSPLLDPSGVQFDEKNMDINKFLAFHNVMYSVHPHKVTLMLEDSLLAARNFEDNSIDFIFVDTYAPQLEEELDVWYSKIKPGGLVSGHDWDDPSIQPQVNSFRKKKQITSTLSTFDSVWVWRKDR